MKIKNKIIIHNPINNLYRKYYHVFFDNLVKKLSVIFDVQENRTWPQAHEKPFPIQLMCNTKNCVDLFECEMILENYSTKELKILSMCDLYTEANLELFNNHEYQQYISTILLAQFNRKSIQHHTNNINYANIYKPWIYFPSNNYNLEKFYKKRQKQKGELINKFYFRGSGTEYGRHRPLINMFDTKLFHGGASIGNFDAYAKEAINYSVGFSCAGVGQFCYRDIEYMAMGIPMLRFTYTNEMNPGLIANKHYIAIEQEFDVTDEHLLTKKHSKLVENRFMQIKDDRDFLDYIATNARNYYLKYLYKNAGINHTINLLNLNNWI
jgi:hypothetical protein